MPDDVARVMAAARPTVVFHCAAVLTVGRAPVPDAVVRAVNVDGTRLLLEHAARVGVKALVFCSSASVTQVNLFEDIRDGDETMPVVEESTNTLLYPKTKVRERTFMFFFLARLSLCIPLPPLPDVAWARWGNRPLQSRSREILATTNT